MEQTVAGLLLGGCSLLYLLAYIPLFVAISKSANTRPSLLIFLSLSIADWMAILNLGLFGLSILVGTDLFPTSYPRLMQAIYGIFVWGPMQFHYTSIAFMRFCAVVMFQDFDIWFTKKTCISIALITWLVGVVFEVAPVAIYPAEAMWMW